MVKEIPKQLQDGMFQLKERNTKVNTRIGVCNEDGWVWSKSIFTYNEANTLVEKGYNIALVLGSLKVVVVDIDNQDAEQFAVQKGLSDTLIERTKRGYHFYYALPDFVTAYASYTHKVNKLELKCTDDSKSRLNTMCCPSVFDGHTYELVSDTPIPYAPKWIVSLIKRNPYAGVGSSSKHSLEAVTDVVMRISDCNTYETWVHVGMATHNLTSGSNEGLALWDSWSSNGSTYKDWEVQRKWESFGNYRSERKVGFKRLLQLADK